MAKKCKRIERTYTYRVTATKEVTMTVLIKDKWTPEELGMLAEDIAFEPEQLKDYSADIEFEVDTLIKSSKRIK